MLILKFLFTVGLALTAGVWALGTYLENGNAARTARTATTTSLPIAPPTKTVVADTDLEVMVGPQKPDKPGTKPSTRHSPSNRDSRRSAH